MNIGIPSLHNLEDLYHSFPSQDLDMCSNPIQLEFSEAAISPRFPIYSVDGPYLPSPLKHSESSEAIQIYSQPKTAPVTPEKENTCFNPYSLAFNTVNSLEQFWEKENLSLLFSFL